MSVGTTGYEFKAGISRQQSDLESKTNGIQASIHKAYKRGFKGYHIEPLTLKTPLTRFVNTGYRFQGERLGDPNQKKQ
jgi:hypothetical protein